MQPRDWATVVNSSKTPKYPVLIARTFAGHEASEDCCIVVHQLDELLNKRSKQLTVYKISSAISYALQPES